MKKGILKRKNSAGFSLPELLIAVVLLVLVTAGLIPAAAHAYRNAVDAANAQMLLSACVNALRNELTTAWDAQQGDTDTELTYMSADTGSRTRLYLDGTVIMLQEYDDYTGSDIFDSEVDSPDERPLVSRPMKTTTQNPANDMTVVYTSIIPADGVVTVHDLRVERNNVRVAQMPDGVDLVIKPLGGENE